MAALLLGGCHLIFPYSAVSAGSFDGQPDLSFADGGSGSSEGFATDAPSQPLKDALVAPRDGSSDLLPDPDPLSLSSAWSAGFGGINVEEPSRVVVDSSGDVYLAGWFSNDGVDFGPPCQAHSNAAGYDAFVVKLSSSGVCQWSWSFGNQSSNKARGLAVDDLGHVYVTGTCQGDHLIGGASHLCGAASDAFIASLSAGTGALDWFKRYGDSASYDSGQGLAASAQGDVYLIGQFSSAQLGLESKVLPSLGSSDIFLAGFDSGGGLLWAQRHGLEYEDQASDIALGPAGSLLIAGSFVEAVELGDGKRHSSAGDRDIFIASYRAAGGDILWSRSFGGAGEDLAERVAGSVAGQVFVTGSFAGTVSFDGQNRQALGGSDVFLAGLSSASGSLLWLRTFGGPSYLRERGMGLAADAQDDVYLTGYFYESASLGGGSISSNGGADIFLGCYRGSDGRHRWSGSYGDSKDDLGLGVTVTPKGEVWVTGEFRSPQLDLGGDPLLNANSIHPNIFLLKLLASSP